jgi:hypothetical protein
MRKYFNVILLLCFGFAADAAKLAVTNCLIII